MKRFTYLFLTALTTISFASCSDDDDAISTDDDMEVDSPMLFATTHSGNIAGYNLETSESYIIGTSSNDAEGIVYDDDMDALLIASRDPMQIQHYNNINMWDEMANSASADMVSSSDLSSPRDIAVSENMVVVSDNADVDEDDTTPDGSFYIYTKTDSGLTLRNTVTVGFKVWGIEFVDNTLYAVVDQTNMLASFDNFLSNSSNGMIEATKMIALEGIGRTHGLDYDDGTMIMSDIGEASSDSDGALHIINDFDNKFNNTENGEMLAVEEQVRISGASTMLGNPVNVSYDEDSGMVFVAELANGDGIVLAFSDNDSGDATPMLNNMLNGVSAVYFED